MYYVQYLSARHYVSGYVTVYRILIRTTAALELSPFVHSAAHYGGRFVPGLVPTPGPMFH